MARRRQGTIEYRPAKPGENQGHYWARVTAPDGSRPWFDLGPGLKSKKAEAEARAAATELSEKLEIRALGVDSRKASNLGGGLVTQPNRWWELYFEHRRQSGLIDEEGRFACHLGAALQLDPVKLTTHDCETLRDRLDDAVAEGTAGAKAVVNVWSLFATAMKAASGRWPHDKRRKLKIRDDNPCLGVLPPEMPEGRERQFLYPDEFLRLVSCESVPLEWRRRYALSVYLFTRASELRALTWTDIDLEHGTVSIRLSFDEERGERRTKTGAKGARRFTLEPNLLPLLEAMKTESEGTGQVTSLPHRKYPAKLLRDHLEASGVSRVELFETTGTRKRLRFHDLRATGLTWLAVRGDNPLRIQQRAGHTTLEMTQVYIRQAEELNVAFGEVFGPLPLSLLGTARSASSGDEPETGASGHEEDDSSAEPEAEPEEEITDDGDDSDDVNSAPPERIVQANRPAECNYLKSQWRRRESNLPRGVSKTLSESRTWPSSVRYRSSKFDPVCPTSFRPVPLSGAESGHHRGTTKREMTGRGLPESRCMSLRPSCGYQRRAAEQRQPFVHFANGL